MFGRLGITRQPTRTGRSGRLTHVFALTIAASLPSCGSKTLVRSQQAGGSSAETAGSSDFVLTDGNEGLVMERSRQAFDEISEAPWDDLRGYSVVHPTEEQATTPPPNYCDDTSAQAPSGVSNDFNELEPVNGSPCGAHAQPSLGAGSRAEAGLQADDVDWFTLVAGGGTYQIATECHGDTLVSVYTNQGELVGRDDNGGDAQCSSLIVGLEAGRHLLRVELAQSTAPGSYTLTVDLL